MMLEVNGLGDATQYVIDTLGPLVHTVTGDQAFVVPLKFGGGTFTETTCYLPSANAQSSSETTYAITDWFAVMQVETGGDPIAITVTGYYANATSGEIEVVKLTDDTAPVPHIICGFGLARGDEATSRQLVKLAFAGGDVDTAYVTGVAFCVRSA